MTAVTRNMADLKDEILSKIDDDDDDDDDDDELFLWYGWPTKDV